MCGRYTIIPKAKGNSRAVKLLQEFQARYNAAPSQALPVITSAEPDKLQFFHWGLLPHWSKDREYKHKPINARAETLTEKPTFKSLLTQKRCLVPADSFFEWRSVGKTKKPYRIQLKSEELFTFAGLWDEWVDKQTGEVEHTFTIITTTANEMVKPLHERMPVMLHPDEENLWLTDAGGANQTHLNMLRPYPAEEMKLYAVTEFVNAASHDSPATIEPEPA
ncbi:MAG: SOS response-associated peptidase, partial [Hymenobacteraceae bacterium]|nr:SOS response-associated peptidase [Hymenobacteraceae bacterium]